MKKYARIRSLLHIFVLYCFVVSLHNNRAMMTVEALHETRSTGHEEGFSLITADLFCSLMQTETLHGLNPQPVSPLKNHINVFLACTKGAELVHLTSYSKYFFYAKNTITWFCQTDVIFPFHYFW